MHGDALAARETGPEVEAVDVLVGREKRDAVVKAWDGRGAREGVRATVEALVCNGVGGHRGRSEPDVTSIIMVVTGGCGGGGGDDDSRQT